MLLVNGNKGGNMSNLNVNGDLNIAKGAKLNNKYIPTLTGKVISSTQKILELSKSNTTQNIILKTGVVPSTSSNAWHTVTFDSPLPDTSYVVTGAPVKNEGNNSVLNIRNKSTTGFQVYLWNNAQFDYIVLYSNVNG